MTPLIVALNLSAVANMIKGYAIAIGVAVAIGFVWTWWAHRQRERTVELTARASGLYGDYLRLAIAHPELQEAQPGTGSPMGTARYRTFVANLLTTAEQILLLDPRPAWKEKLSRQLEPHRAFLMSEEFRAGDFNECSTLLKSVIERVTRS